jgi:GTP-binding protein
LLFCDHVKIHVASGSGAKGCVSFRREKNIPFGGPDGGHGGRGGHVLARATRNLMTLIDFRYRPHVRAQNGRPGAGRKRAGAAGKDAILLLPTGTEIWSMGELVVDLITHDQEVLLVRGGDGGCGNAVLATSTHQIPRHAFPGQPGQESWLELKLKLLADIGLIGLPNAGKSTLLQKLTGAASKIGDYPFTTLRPYLGMLITPSHQELLLADLPGLILGASEGRGLGHRFLGHAERCRGFLHVLDGSAPDLLESYEVIRQELRAYNPALLEKPEFIVVTKKDLDLSPHKKDLDVLRTKAPLFWVSSITGEGLDALQSYVFQRFF